MALETNDYIVKFTKNIHDYTRTTEKFDAFLELNSTNDIPTIVIRTCKDKFDFNNRILFHKHITKEFAKVEFNDSNRSCCLSYQDGYSRSISYKSMIDFDDNSSSAYSTFKDAFEKLLNTKSESQYFDSGRLRYVGEVLELQDEENSYNGKGVLYYNTCSNVKKFVGQFEDGEFDGAGEFFNEDGNIKIIALNISNGVPVQKGKLHINFQSREEIVVIDFSNLWEILCIKDKRSLRKFVASDDFVNKTARLYWGNSDKSMDDVVFEEKSVSQQNVLFWNKLKEMTSEINEVRLDIRTQAKSRMLIDEIIICFVLLSTILNFITLLSK